MNKQGFGVEVIVDIDKKTIPLRPSCPHGPMLLFERYTPKGKNSGRRFFACSANRSRKLCSSFYWADEIANFSAKKPADGHQKTSKTVPNYFKRAQKILGKKSNLPKFCKTCSLLLLPSEHSMHKGHDIEETVTDSQLLRPSKLLVPQEDSRQYAQYFFSDHTVSFIIKTLKNLEVSNVLCIGTPRVHEELVSEGFSSLLMDMDERYAQFYKRSQYVKYNVFNHHFFESNTSAYQEILQQDSLCIMLDPPFGGLIDAIAHTVKQITDAWTNAKPRSDGRAPLVLWFFPYFNEKRILQAFPAMHMLDFKIDYENHQSFNGASASNKHGSPIRIFTNYDLKSFEPPNLHEYRFCDRCQKYVTKGNSHCKKCKACTSKDGCPYRHCDDCQRCVKISWHHCPECRQCVVQDHKCGSVPAPGACHICGHFGHKRKQCPDQKGKKRKKQRSQ